jgi:type II secretory pathway component PulC
VNGQIQGYRIYPGSDRQEFLSLGLRPGDLVTEIDGEPLVNSTIAFELFEKALDGQPEILSVRRSGELERVEINAD